MDGSAEPGRLLHPMNEAAGQRGRSGQLTRCGHVLDWGPVRLPSTIRMAPFLISMGVGGTGSGCWGCRGCRSESGLCPGGPGHRHEVHPGGGGHSQCPGSMFHFCTAAPPPAHFGLMDRFVEHMTRICPGPGTAKGWVRAAPRGGGGGFAVGEFRRENRGDFAVQKGGDILAEPFHTSPQLQGLCLLRAWGISSVAKSPRREVVRSSAGVSVVYHPFLGSFA